MPGHAETLLKTYPDIDAVFVNSGIQKSFSWADPSTSSDKDIIDEVTTNVTAPYLTFRAVFPHLMAKAASGKPAALLATSSGLAFIPVAPLYAVYNSTKAAMHSALVTMRGQLGSMPEAVQKNFSIVEVAPPKVSTELDVGQKMKGKAMPSMDLQDYIDQSMEGLMAVEEDGKMKKEIGTGFSQMGIDAWRNAFGPMLQKMGNSG